MAQKIAPTLVVIRHGESDANRKEVISDKVIDHPLTELGVAQAHEIAKRLENEAFDLLVSSTRQRAQATGQIINKFHNAQLILTDDLIERDHGIFSGIDKSKAHEMMLEGGFGWVDVPESETASEIDHRVGRVVSMLSEEYAGLRILVSTHEDIVRSFYRILGGRSVAESMLVEISNSEPHYFVSSG
jgi:broad specificity phosphatase PhoE